MVMTRCNVYRSVYPVPRRVEFHRYSYTTSTKWSPLQKLAGSVTTQASVTPLRHGSPKATSFCKGIKNSLSEKYRRSMAI